MVDDRWKIQSGYTLIEILVSLTIIGILFGFGYVNFRDFSRRQALAGVVKQIQGDIRLAQQMGLSGQKPAACGVSNTLIGYSFTISSPSEYKIVASCAGAVPGSTKDVTLPSGIAVSSTMNSILFKVLGQGTNIPGGVSVVLTFKQAGTGNTSTVTVTSGGEIK